MPEDDPKESAEPDEVEAMRKELEAHSTEELVSILRNQDETEWRPEVFEIVAAILSARGLSPDEVKARGPEGFDVVEGRKIVTLGRYFSTIEAHAHRLALEQLGIPAWVSDEELGGMYGVGIGARLQVRAEDEEAARAALAAKPTPASALPPELAEPPCPACGSREVTQRADIALDQPPLSGPAPARVWRYECAACGHTWSD